MIKIAIFVSVLSFSTLEQSLVSKDESLICKQFFVNEDDFHYISGSLSFANLLPEEITIIAVEKRIKKVPCGKPKIFTPAWSVIGCSPQKVKLGGIV